MKTEMSQKTRTVRTGVAAFAITTVLVSTLVEALNPALLFSANGYAEQKQIAAVSLRRDESALEA
jgi:hypothetical protein